MDDKKDVSIYSGGRGGGKTEETRRRIGVIGLSKAQVDALQASADYGLNIFYPPDDQPSKPDERDRLGLFSLPARTPDLPFYCGDREATCKSFCTIQCRRCFDMEYRSEPSQSITVGNNQENSVMTETDKKTLEALDKVIEQQTIRVEGLQIVVAYGYGARESYGRAHEHNDLLRLEGGVLRSMMWIRQNIQDKYAPKVPLVVVPESEIHPSFHPDFYPKKNE